MTLEDAYGNIAINSDDYLPHLPCLTRPLLPPASPLVLLTRIRTHADVYPLRAKLTGNCGGAGICGTCAVKVLDGANNINPPSKNEQNTLRGKSADLRLSCCARVSGPISIKTKP